MLFCQSQEDEGRPPMSQRTVSRDSLHELFDDGMDRPVRLGKPPASPASVAKLERKELEPPFTPRAGRVPNVPDQNLVKKFGPHRLSDGDSPSKEGGNSDEVSLSFKGEQFQGFSVFASPAPPVRRKSSKDLK